MHVQAKAAEHMIDPEAVSKDDLCWDIRLETERTRLDCGRSQTAANLVIFGSTASKGHKVCDTMCVE